MIGAPFESGGRRARATKHLYEIPVSTPPRDDEIARLYHDL